MIQIVWFHIAWLLLSCFAATAVLLTFGQKQDSGLTLFQKLIRSVYRVTRWIYAIGLGLNAFYTAYRTEMESSLPVPENEQIFKPASRARTVLQHS